MSRPLDTTSDEFRNNHYTYVIYWKPRKGYDALQPGHAALIIDSSSFKRGSPAYYISWIGTGTSKAFGTIINMQRAITYVDDSRVLWWLPRRSLKQRAVLQSNSAGSL